MLLVTALSYDQTQRSLTKAIALSSGRGGQLLPAVFALGQKAFSNIRPLRCFVSTDSEMVSGSHSGARMSLHRISARVVPFRGVSRCKLSLTPVRISHRRRCQPADDSSPSQGDKSLGSIIKQKQNELAVHLAEFDESAIEDRLSAAMQTGNPNPHRLAQLVQSIKMTQGRPVLIFELERSQLSRGVTEAQTLVSLAQKFESCAVDCLCISTDTATSEGIKDIFTVTRSIKIPVIARDWYIHPIQILEAKEAGASGVMGVIASVSGHGTPLLSSYSAAIGIDAPVEVVNLKQVEEMGQHGVPMFCVNCSVGLSITGIAGVVADLTKGLLEALPFGAVSVVGVKSMDEARSATYAGADCLLVKASMVPSVGADLENFVDQIKYATSGDD